MLVPGFPTCISALNWKANQKRWPKVEVKQVPY